MGVRINPKYERHLNEPDFEYGLRLIEMKIEEKPDDLDWEDIIEAVGIDCHRDTLRKAASVSPYSGYAVAQYFKKKYSGKTQQSNSYSDELDQKILTFKKEAKKFYDQRREFNKCINQEGRSEHVEDQIILAANRLNEEYPLVEFKDIMELPVDNEAVVVFSDWHYGMTTDNIWGSYDTKTCIARVSSLVERVKQRIALHRCRKIHIILLGDLAHGAIHTSARVAAEELVCDQIMQVSEIVAQAISMIADMTEETLVYATYGNHLRTVQNKKDNLHADNMEKLIPWWLELRLKDRTDIRFPGGEVHEFISLFVCGKHIVAAHGDLDNVKSAGQMLNTLFTKKYGHSLDYIILGDKHHEEWFDELGIKSMVAGCLCGTDEYANGKRLYSNPSQLMMVFNPEDGLDAVYQIQF